MITMEDVAKAAGVSRKTVYNVINNKGSVSADVRLKVKKCIKDLDYKTSIVAQSLKTGNTNLIGVILPDLYHPAYVSFLECVEREARLAGYNIIACNYDYKVELEKYYFDMLYKRNADGIIYNNFILDNSDYDCRTNVLKAKEMGFPIVSLGENMEKGDFSNVSHNTEKALDEAFKFYLNKGYKKPAFIFTEYYKDIDYKVRKPYKFFHSRVYWYYQTCEKYGIEPEVLIYSDVKITYLDKVEAFLKRDTYDCIICETDYIAVGLYQLYSKIGKKPLPILGFDNSEYGMFFKPSISSFSPNYSFTAKKSVEVLLDEINGKCKEPQHIMTDMVFIERESTENC